jgi:hypothetical protein
LCVNIYGAIAKVNFLVKYGFQNMTLNYNDDLV